MSDIKRIIDEAIKRIREASDSVDEDRLDEILEKAEQVDALAEEVKTNCTDIVKEITMEKEPFESDLHFRGRVEGYEGNPDALQGEGGALRDVATYWWRGLPVEVEVSWLNGEFTITLFKQATGKRCGQLSIKFRSLLNMLEVSKEDGDLQAALGEDYGRMFGTVSDIHDTYRSNNS